MFVCLCVVCVRVCVPCTNSTAAGYRVLVSNEYVFVCLCCVCMLKKRKCHTFRSRGSRARS